MIARQCITVSGVKTELLLSVTIVVNGEEGGVGTLGSESFPTCLPLRLASRGPCEALSYLLDKFRERFSNGAATSLVGSANWWFHQLALVTPWEPIFQLWLSIYSILGNLHKYSLKNITGTMLNSWFNLYSTLRIFLMGQERAWKMTNACLSKGKFQTF